jgi:aspartate carbamoyltransferase catalytic subunit
VRTFEHKDLLGMEALSVADINLILDTADSLKSISMREIKKAPTLRGKSVVNFFYEPSTRTRSSFEIAAKRLSADTFSLSASTSSMVKGETLLDTARNLQAMNPDVIILRHSSSGAPYVFAKALRLLLSMRVTALTSTRPRHFWIFTPFGRKRGVLRG